VKTAILEKKQKKNQILFGQNYGVGILNGVPGGKVTKLI
jgi:hypothetical protein